MHSPPATHAAQVHAERPQIHGLTGIRALAAAWVVVEHFGKPLFALFPGTVVADRFVKAGYLGVEVFFVLSGFIIAYTYAHQFEKFSWVAYRRFMLLRFARIYPVHLVTLVTVLFLVLAAGMAGIRLNSQGEYSVVGFLANAVMLQAVPPFAPWNGPAWSICAEFAAYMAFPILAIWLARIHTARQGLLAGGFILLGGTGMMLITAAFINSSPTGYELIWLRISTEFTAGAFLYAGWRHLGASQRGRGWDWTAMLSLLAIVGIISTTEADNVFALAAVPVIGLFVLSCAGVTGWLARVLSSKPMIWGGKVSYSVYMTHFLLLMVFGKILPWEPFVDSALPVRLAVMGIYYASVVVIGASCYYLVEEPARRAIRRATDARAAPVIAGP